MPFKQDYLNDVRLESETYKKPATAIVRIQRIYGSARRGSLDCDLATHLWEQFFDPLRGHCIRLPVKHQDYDDFVIREMRRLARRLRYHHRGNFGIAQKMVNLSLKDHWSLNLIPPLSEPLLHIPLDRLILSKFEDLPKTWKSWTKAVENRQTLSDYSEIQNCFRHFWRHLNSDRSRFASPLEIEQLIWHPLVRAESKQG